MEKFLEALREKLNKQKRAKRKDYGIKKIGPILESTKKSFESTAVLNPAVYQEGKFVHIFYRAIGKDGRSTIGYAKLKGPAEVAQRREKPIISIDYDYESEGVEDPRIVKIGRTFYLTYVAYDGKNAYTALAVSKDLKNFKKEGIISPLMEYNDAGELFREQQLKDRYSMFQAYYEEMVGEDVKIWFKDALLFPKKFYGHYLMLIRVLPDIQLICFKNFKQLKNHSFWSEYIKNISHFVVLENKYWFESRNIGGGAIPLLTEKGWLIIFHTVEELNKTRVYHASAALLDKDNPLKVIGRADEPLFSPDEEWEKQGLVGNVIFPTGTALFKDDLYIYYGAADIRIAAAKIKLSALLKELKNRKK